MDQDSGKTPEEIAAHMGRVHQVNEYLQNITIGEALEVLASVAGIVCQSSGRRGDCAVNFMAMFADIIEQYADSEASEEADVLTKPKLEIVS